MKRTIFVLFFLTTVFLGSFFVVKEATAFEATSTTFEIHAGSLSSIAGSSSASNFVLLGNGGGSAFGNITQGIFKVFSGIVNWFFSVFTQYQQNHYRWRNDNGTEVTATFADAEDTAHSNIAVATPIRLRIGISNSWFRTTDSSSQFRIEYSQTTTCSSGSYTAVPTTATTEHWQMADSLNLTDANATTNVVSGLTDGNVNFTAGQVKDTGNMTTAISIPALGFTELEYSISATANAVGGANYCFRVTNNSVTTKFSYSIYPQITVVSGGTPTMDQLHYRWFNDDGVENTATPTNNTDAILSGAYVGDRKRLRILVQNSGTGSASNITYRLDIASTTCTTWYPVPNTATTEHWGMDLSGYVANGTPTTDSSWVANPGGKTFTPGFVMTSSNQTTAHTLSSSQFTEFEYSIKSTANVSTGTTYCFRLTNAGSITNFTYTVQPQATVLPQDYKPIGGGGSSGGGEGSGTGAVIGGGASTGGGTTEGGGSGTPVGGGGGSGGGDSE